MSNLQKKLFDHGKYKQIHNLAVSLTFSDPDQWNWKQVEGKES